MDKKSPQPPGMAVWLLKRFFPDKTGLYTQLGDIDEAFNTIAREKGNFAAQAWYWITALRSIPYSIMRTLAWSSTMMRNYLKIALRNMRKYKTGSFINVAGLSLGLAFCVLIYLFISDELSFDRFHEKADSIYSIVINDHFYEYSRRYWMVPIAPVLKDHFPEIESFARLVREINVPVKYNDNIFNENICLADPEFLEIFSFRPKKGNPGSALYSDSSVVLTQNMANKYFGNEEPIGKTMKIGPQPPLTIIGVVKNFHYSSLREEVAPAALNMDPTVGLSYAVVRVSAANMAETITYLRERWEEIQSVRPFEYSFLDDDIQSFYADENRWNSIVGYSSFFTILIACMGVFGLTLITVNNRVKEIGIRKILGASILSILKLVTSEFVILVLIANIIVWPLAWAVMNKWLQNFACRIDFGVWPLLISGIITALIALLTSCGYSLKAAIANPADSLRYE